MDYAGVSLVNTLTVNNSLVVYRGMMSKKKREIFAADLESRDRI